MSRISDKLSKLHKTSAPMGFGFVARQSPERRMLLMASFVAAPTEESVPGLADVADCVVLRGVQLPKGINSTALPAGCWMAGDEALPEGISNESCDFVISAVDGPASILSVEGLGWIPVLEQGAEASYLRAVAEVGAEAVLVSGDSIDLTLLSTFVELRRMRLLSGRPLFLSVDAPIDAGTLVALSRAGVEGLIVAAEGGLDTLKQLAETLVSTASRMGKSRKDEAVAVVGHVVGTSVDEELEEEGEEEEDDE